MPENKNGINRTRTIIGIVWQSLAITGVILTVVYFPVNTKLDAMDSKIDMVQAQHEKDCKGMLEATKELKSKVETKVSEKVLKLHLDPLTKNVAEIKESLDKIINKIIKE